MNLLVRSPDGPREADCSFMDRFDAAIVQEWSDSVKGTKSAQQEDAVEYCESVAAQWSAYEKRRRIVRSLDELLDRRANEPEEESMGVLSVRANWYAGGQVLAICEFRRTWCNNIVFDFLAVRPDLLAKKPLPIAGVGTALLRLLSHVAQRLDVGTVWAETTSASVGFYRNKLGLKQHSGLTDDEQSRIL